MTRRLPRTTRWTPIAWSATLCLIAAWWPVAPLTAQDARPAVVSAGTHDRAAGSAAAVLDCAIALRLDRVPLRDALVTVANRAAIRLLYSRDQVPVNKVVSLVTDKITVRDAFSVLLEDTGLEVVVAPSGQVRLRPTFDVPAPTGIARQSTGGISGRVTDVTTGGGVGHAAVRLDGTLFTVTTGTDGRYAINDVPPGAYRLSARRLGYAPSVRAVTVVPDTTVNADIELTPSAALLDQVVTTMTGDQHLRQLGNMIGTIPADSVVAAASVANLGDIISARVPGVQVFVDGGLVGASQQIAIRGLNTFNASNQPLVYVDGVRVENGSAGATNATSSPTGRLDDIAPQEIESIEIVKGPSAATLYGTDAANGVIQITTKRGAQGAPRWYIFGEQGISRADTSRFPDSYNGWGHDATGASTNCTLLLRTAGGCALDSVTHFSPYKNGATTPFGTGIRSNYGAQVSGGSAAVRYFLSGTVDDETGYLKMPSSEVPILAAARGAVGISSDELHPNGLAKYSFRQSLTAGLGRTADVAVSAGYVSQKSFNPRSNAIFFGLFGPGYRDASDGYGFGLEPLNTFENRSVEDINHFTGGMTGTWRPTSWLVGRGTAGLDHSIEYEDGLSRGGDPSVSFSSRTASRNTVSLVTYNLILTATGHLGDVLQARTSIGGNYNRKLVGQSNAFSYQLPQGCLVVQCGNVFNPSEGEAETIVLGGYGEEQLSYRDRLYVTVGGRYDAGNTFGSDVSGTFYPKASLSWLVSQEPLWPKNPGVSSLRLRAAYGESGNQPSQLARLDQENTSPAYVNGTIQGGNSLPSYGNPSIKPERQREFEAGADVDLLQGRIELQITGYKKKTIDALVTAPVPTSLPGTGFPINAGAVSNQGWEALLSARIVDSRLVTWDASINGSMNRNQLVSLGPQITSLANLIGFPALRQGYPIFSYYGYRVHWNGMSQGGVIGPGDLTVDSTPSFVGPTSPVSQYTYATAVGLFRSALQLKVQVDYRGGFYEQGREFDQCIVDHCRAAFDLSAPLTDRISYAAIKLGNFAPYLADASFTRLREVAATYNLPTRLVSVLRVRSAAFTVAGRNLAIWTNFRGSADPETAGAEIQPGVGAYWDAGGIIPPAYWLLRLSLGF